MVHVLVMTVPTNYQPDSGHFFDFFQNRDVPKIIIFQKIVAQSIFGVEPFFFFLFNRLVLVYTLVKPE